MPFLSIGHGKIYYECLGEGEPIVLLRGLTRHSKHWLGFEKLVAERYKVICVDARGFGKSNSSVSWMLTIRDLAHDVIMVLDELKISKAHFFGVSLGGMIALEAAMSFPTRCKTLTVVNSSMGGVGLQRMTAKGIIAVAKGAFFPERLHHDLSQLMLGSVTSEEARKTFADKWRSIDTETEIPKLNSVKQLLAAFRFKNNPRLAAIKIPTMIMIGAADSFVPTQNSYAIHRSIPNAHLCVMPGSGHEIHYDYPEHVADELHRFIEKSSI